MKFIRAAYVWFIIATAMLVFTPLYNFGIYMSLTGSHVPFSQAFFGAYRHVLTVGFIMMMIVGVSPQETGTATGLVGAAGGFVESCRNNQISPCKLGELRGSVLKLLRKRCTSESHGDRGAA